MSTEKIYTQQDVETTAPQIKAAIESYMQKHQIDLVKPEAKSGVGFFAKIAQVFSKEEQRPRCLFQHAERLCARSVRLAGAGVNELGFEQQLVFMEKPGAAKALAYFLNTGNLPSQEEAKATQRPSKELQKALRQVVTTALIEAGSETVAEDAAGIELF